MDKDGNTSAAQFLPDKLDLESLRLAAACCEGCGLYRNATQTVFGEGPSQARFMLVGEQPGDQEDRQGHPFVGPAGRILDKGLAEAGIPRDDVYVTNAVKHFSFVPRGKRRIHQKPTAAEVTACHPWLDAELAVVDPSVIVVLGATAAQALLGRTFRVTQHRGSRCRSATRSRWPPSTRRPCCARRTGTPRTRASCPTSKRRLGLPDHQAAARVA